MKRNCVSGSTDIWKEIAQPWVSPSDRPLTLVGYESALTIRAFVEPIAIGTVMIDMPLYLEPDGYVLVPLESTYSRAFEALPKRWRSVVEERSLRSFTR